MNVRRLLAKITSIRREDDDDAPPPLPGASAQDAPMTRDEDDDRLTLGFSLRRDDEDDRG